MRHLRSEVVEKYSLRRLSELEEARTEEHQLVCEKCRDHLGEFETFIRAMARRVNSDDFRRRELKVQFPSGLARRSTAIICSFPRRETRRSPKSPAAREAETSLVSEGSRTKRKS